MTGPVAAAFVIPIVVAIALFGWLIAVLRADTHPSWKHHSNLPRNEVTGGAFRALSGGRQLMPLPGGRPAPDDAEFPQSATIPAPRAGADQGAPAAPGSDQAEERHLVTGSKLR